MDCPGLTMAKMVASWGGRVVPAFVTKEGDKIPLAGNWVVNATKDEVQLEKWWSERPWTWPGIVSGVDSLLVLDCDGSEGVKWFRALCTRIGWTNGALAYTTPGRDGGLHVVWRWPEWLGRDFRQAKVVVEGGEIQLRGNGHFTLLCGARRPDCGGREYGLVEEPGPGGPVVAPEALIRAFLKESVVATSTAPLSASTGLGEVSPEEAWKGAPYVVNASEPGRKNQLARLAWYLAIRGVSEPEILSICVRFGEECCVPVLSEDFCVSKARGSIRRAEVYRKEAAAEAEKLLGLWGRYSAAS